MVVIYTDSQTVDYWAIDKFQAMLESNLGRSWGRINSPIKNSVGPNSNWVNIPSSRAITNTDRSLKHKNINSLYSNVDKRPYDLYKLVVWTYSLPTHKNGFLGVILLIRARHPRCRHIYIFSKTYCVGAGGLRRTNQSLVGRKVVPEGPAPQGPPPRSGG